MIIIPIGIQCSSAMFKNDIEKTSTMPFDWILSNPKFVFEMLQLLLEKDMNVEELVKDHFLFCEKRANVNTFEHYFSHDDGFALYNSKYNVIFPHDNNSIETMNKYIRRFERLKNTILNSNEDLCFLYTSQSSLEIGNFTIDGNVVIKDVYFYLSQIHKLIGKFRLNYKIILFDAIQEEDVELLNTSIILCKLNRRDNCKELFPEMMNYVKLFSSLNN